VSDHRRPEWPSSGQQPRWPVADRDPQWPQADEPRQRPQARQSGASGARRQPPGQQPRTQQPGQRRRPAQRQAPAAGGRAGQQDARRARDPQRGSTPRDPQATRRPAASGDPQATRRSAAPGDPKAGRAAASRDPRAARRRPAEPSGARAERPRDPNAARRRPPRRPEGARGPQGAKPRQAGAAAAGAGAAAAGFAATGRHANPADPDGPTETLPPIDAADYQIAPPREPELLTHRYHDNGGEEHDPAAEDRINALIAESDSGEPEPAGRRNGKPPLTRKQRRWRLVRRLAYGFVGVFVILPILGFTIAYFLVDFPKPAEIVAAQSKTVNYYFSDGSTLLGRDSQDGNRVILKPEQIPDVVKHAVYAAEDETFETNSGFDIMGILRAVRNQLTGGVGGGSTITQQYIKQATGDDEISLVRKGLEIVKAFKMSNELEKSEIITAYLNTIYFGRGAYGIQAASQAYFNKDVDKLNPSQAAYLAGIIQAPSRGDNREYAERRWNYVIGQMKENGWLTQEEAAEAKFPQIESGERKLQGFTGPRYFIKERIRQELNSLGFTEDKVRLQGYKIYTTINKKAQSLAEKTVREVMKGQPKNLREALVAVDPNTGGVKAYYGGENDESDQVDWANTPRNPGSSIKPFDFVALLKQGKGPYAAYDGSSPRTFPGDGVPISNSENVQCPMPCTVMEAMEKSINTVFYDMVVNEVKPSGVVEALKEAGVKNTSQLSSELNNIAIGGGDNKVSPRDMAAAYATFAAQGVQRDAHFVSKITTPDGEVVYQAHDKTRGKPAFDPDEEKSKQIAGNVTKTLEPVLPYSGLVCDNGRACAGKTGTHEAREPYSDQNSQAWMVGYTRQLSTAVWVGDSALNPIKNAEGGVVYGKGLPGQIWLKFMNEYHKDMDNLPFDEVELIGDEAPPPPPPKNTPEKEDDDGRDEDEEKPENKPDRPSKPDNPPKPPEDPTTDPDDPSTDPTPPCQPPLCRPPNDGQEGPGNTDPSGA
jgi:membrane peptidoglycan carboxypeptidase